MKKIIYTVSALLLGTGVFAQNLVDALRYSDYKITGTARSAAMGNAFGALGGDFTSLSINPAGLGVYRSDEFVFTLDPSRANVDASYLGHTASESKYRLSLDNLGYVGTIRPANTGQSSLVSLNFGIGYNRLNNYKQDMLIEGYNSQESMIDTIIAKTNGINYNDLFYENNPYENVDWDSEMAWQTYLIEPDGESKNQYVARGLYEGEKVDQRKTVSKEGYINEYLFSFAANFNHKFYLGATIGIHDLNYEESSIHTEYNLSDLSQKTVYLDNFSYYQNLKTTGTGYNFKIGAIFKPINEIRLGIAFHSPTFYDLNDRYDYSIVSQTDQGLSQENSPHGEYDYHLETPFRTIFSAAYVIAKKGLISIDYELVDYSTAKLKNGAGNYHFTDENNDIKEAYKSVGNLHIGGEYRITNAFSLRAGYENYPSAYESYAFGADQKNKNADYSAVSAGFGYNQGNFFADMAYKHQMMKEYGTLYAGSDFAKYKIKNDNVIFTLGFKF